MPFVVCDPRRRESEASVRSTVNISTGLAAMRSALGGSLCVWSRRLPRDFNDIRVALRDPMTRVQLIVCAESLRHSKPYHIEPIMVPPLQSRPHEINRIIDECAEEAATELFTIVTLTAADREWILRHSASSVTEIEKGTRRVLSIRQHDGHIPAAARSLGMAPISLSRWIGRRGYMRDVLATLQKKRPELADR
jgi:hypothetical protein